MGVDDKLQTNKIKTKKNSETYCDNVIGMKTKLERLLFILAFVLFFFVVYHYLSESLYLGDSGSETLQQKLI